MPEKIDSINEVNDIPPAIGRDGAITFVLSNILLLASFGMYWFWLMRFTYRVARRSTVSASESDYITVPGMQLLNNQVQPLYAERLRRAKKCFDEGVANKILLIGGTLKNNTVSEAESGKQFLLAKNMAVDAIVLEDRSRHTLENLYNIRGMYLSDHNRKITLISNRFHLARCHLLAKGLGIKHELCAAEAQCQHDLSFFLKIMKEAYFIHWYQVGKLWAHVTENEKSLNRIR